MSCNHCNAKFTSDCNYVTCLCNCKIHYQCLHPFNSLPHQWISSNPVKKHVISILTSSSFQYICTKCSTSNLSSSQYSSQTPIPPTDANNIAHPDSPYSTTHTEFHDIEKLINNISSRLDKQDSLLTKIDKLLNSHTYNYNDHPNNNLHQSFLKSPVNCHHTPQIHHHLISLPLTVDIHSLPKQCYTQCHPNNTTTHQYLAICPTLVLCFLQWHNSHPTHFTTPPPVHPTIITFLEYPPQDQNIKTIP